MQERASMKKAPKKAFIHRRWFWMLIGLVVCGAVSIILLPVGIDYGIERYLKDQGADQVKLEDVDFNPFTGHTILKNLTIVLSAQMVLSIPEAMLDIEWRPFINKRFVLKRVTISDTEITVKNLETGRWQVGGILLPHKNETAGPSDWNFGLQQVTIENSTIKFISPQLSSDLKIEQATIQKLSSWLPEQSARLELKGQLNEGNLELEVDVTPFANLIITAGHIRLNGLTLMPFARLLEPHFKSLEGRLDADLKFEVNQMAEEKLKVDADGKLNGSKLSTIIKNTNLQIQQNKIDWQGKIAYIQTAAAKDLNLDGVLGIQNVNLKGYQINLSEEKLNWKGVFTFSSISNPDAEQNITSDGALSTGLLAVSLPQQKINIEHAGLEWQGKLAYAQNKATKSINADGQIHLDAAKLKLPELNLSEEKLSWKGKFQFSAPAESAGQRIMTDGTLNGSRLQVDLPNRKLKYDHRGLALTGRLDTGEAKNLSGITAEGGIVLNDARILQAKTNRHLLSSHRVDLQAIQVKGLDDIHISSSALAGLVMLAAPDAGSPVANLPSLRLQEVKFNDVRLSQQNNLAIASIQLNDVKAAVHRDTEGKLPAIESWRAIQKDIFAVNQAERATTGPPAKKNADDFTFRIGVVEIFGDSEIQIRDESVSPDFSMDLSILEARVTQLDSSLPEQPASVKLQFSDKENARLSLAGNMQPFTDKLNLDWVGKIEAVELPPLSPYAIRSTGFRFTSGELEADLPFKIAQNELSGQIDLTLFNPRIKRAKLEDTTKKSTGKIQLNMTLDSALRLLRDKQNNVKLNIPVSGDIRDPQFSVAGAINKVLARTLQASALSYLKYTLGPYGIGISVAQLAYEQALKIRLNPIKFAPGSDELNETAIDYLQRVATIMKDYPAVQVVLCGVATESDRGAIGGARSAKNREPSSAQTDNTDTELLALAEQRADQIQNRLVDVHSIAAKRIIGCEPKIAKRTDATPRVDLEL
jgi:outer membrane protein OmpA-like peptidoglycan-associated protein